MIASVGLVGSLLWLATVVAPLSVASTVEIRVDKKQGADEWFCALEAETTATIVTDGNIDRVTITIAKITARMEALPTMPEPFRAQIGSESPAQQTFVDPLRGKTATFTVDRKTNKVKLVTALSPTIEYAGVDLTYWLASAWFADARRVVPTFWKKSWELNSSTAGKALPYLAESGALGGMLTVGDGNRATQLRLHVTRRATNQTK